MWDFIVEVIRRGSTLSSSGGFSCRPNGPVVTGPCSGLDIPRRGAAPEGGRLITALFWGGGVVGYLVPFRIPCRWEPGVPVRRLVLTRYVRNRESIGSRFSRSVGRQLCGSVPYFALCDSCCASPNPADDDGMVSMCSFESGCSVRRGMMQ